MVGHPNAGKSSVINSVCAGKKVSVSRTAGHTKRAQTVPLVPGVVSLLDCPGLVFPHATVPPPEPRAEDPAAAARLDHELKDEIAMQQLLGVIPIAQVREPYTAVRYLTERVALEKMYGLNLPHDEEGWSPLLLCEQLAVKRGLHIARTGRPDSHSAGREILYDAQDGIIPLAWTPPAIPASASASGSSIGIGASAGSGSAVSEAPAAGSSSGHVPAGGGASVESST